MNILLVFILNIYFSYVNVNGLVHEDTVTRVSVSRKEFIEKNFKENYQEIQAKKAKKRKHSRLKALLYLLPSFFGIAGLHKWYLENYKGAYTMILIPCIPIFLGSIPLVASIIIGTAVFEFLNILALLFLGVFMFIGILIVWSFIDLIRVIGGDLKFKDGTQTEW